MLVHITSSEPRDVAQLERTYLSTVKLCGFLMLAAIAMMYDFRMSTSGSFTHSSHKINQPMTYVLLGASAACMVVYVLNYFFCVHRYIHKQIQTANYNTATVGVTLAMMVVFVGINVVLLVEAYT